MICFNLSQLSPFYIWIFICSFGTYELPLFISYSWSLDHILQFLKFTESLTLTFKVHLWVYTNVVTEFFVKPYKPLINILNRTGPRTHPSRVSVKITSQSDSAPLPPTWHHITHLLNDEPEAVNCVLPARTFKAVVSLTPFWIQIRVCRKDGRPLGGLFWVHWKSTYGLWSWQYVDLSAHMP